MQAMTFMMNPLLKAKRDWAREKHPNTSLVTFVKLWAVGRNCCARKAIKGCKGLLKLRIVETLRFKA